MVFGILNLSISVEGKTGKICLKKKRNLKRRMLNVRPQNVSGRFEPATFRVWQNNKITKDSDNPVSQSKLE